jgi:phosphoribosylamine--glycine ligase
MNILILGAGGREHAFAWKIRQSPSCDQLYVAPGNAGTAAIATNEPIAATDFDAISALVLERRIDLVLVGPEEPLVRGIRDHFRSRPDLAHVLLVGPDAAGARLEGSKDWAKAFMRENDIPTAKSATFTAETLSEGLEYLRTHPLPVVLKADGLAAGKGVVIAPSHENAEATLRDMLGGQFGEASRKVVVEEFLAGIELSVFVLTDGRDYVLLPEAKDYKRVGEADTGLNTGGMGAVSPVPFADVDFLAKVDERIVKPTVAGLQRGGMDYVGFLFIGLMNVGGDPYVIEYNVRMGDPETEVVLPRLRSDLVKLLEAAARKELAGVQPEVDPHTAVTVMLVSGGYPGRYEKGKPMTGLAAPEGVISFHAGTKLIDNGVVTDGGRVLALTALGATIEEAAGKARDAAEKVDFEGKYFRRDIGMDLLAYL